MGPPHKPTFDAKWWVTVTCYRRTYACACVSLALSLHVATAQRSLPLRLEVRANVVSSFVPQVSGAILSSLGAQRGQSSQG